MEDIDYREPVSLEHVESDEEDAEGYFLQTTADAYDIKEKIKSANEELFEEYNSDIDYREQRVKFNDAVDYEPYYSSDDGYVHSPYALGSDNEIENEVIQEQEECVYETINEEELIEEIQEINLDCIEEINNQEIEPDEEIIEELTDESKSDENVIEFIQNSDLIDETDLEISVIHCDEESSVIETSSKKKYKEKITINCRKHCLEKKDLDLLNKGYETTNIPQSNELNLKLKQKYCCKYSQKPKLPIYNGLKSEYGLTESQIERKRLKKERKLQHKREQKLRIREEKIQKEMYNEEIFCAWLKSVAQRNKNRSKNCYKTYEQRRPKTASCENSTRNSKIRPKSSCLYGSCNTIILYPGVTMKTMI